MKHKEQKLRIHGNVFLRYNKSVLREIFLPYLNHNMNYLNAVESHQLHPGSVG